MRIGINGSSLVALGRSLDDIARHAAEADADGFSTYWLPQLAIPDALTAFAHIGPRTSTVELGTAVIPTWLRHPLMLAAQALTVQEVAGNRLVLGIGLAHKPTIEERLKIPFDRPVRHMREYLSVLLSALHERSVSFEGEIWSGEIDSVPVPAGVEAPTVMVAAMGPQMLRLAGERTAGTILWLSGPATIAEHVAPTITKAAADAGRPAPRIVASVPVCVTSRPDEVRAMIGEVLAGYNELPSYRAMLDREGAAGPADVAVVGDEAEVEAGLARFNESGTTDFSALEFALTDEEVDRTRALLKALASG